MSDLKIPDMPWLNIEEGIQKLREIGTLQWICHIRPTHPLWEGSEGRPFIKTVRNRFVRGALAFLKSATIALL